MADYKRMEEEEEEEGNDGRGRCTVGEGELGEARSPIRAFLPPLNQRLLVKMPGIATNPGTRPCRRCRAAAHLVCARPPQDASPLRCAIRVCTPALDRPAMSELS